MLLIVKCFGGVCRFGMELERRTRVALVAEAERCAEYQGVRTRVLYLPLNTALVPMRGYTETRADGLP